MPENSENAIKIGEDVEDYLQRREARFSDIKPGQQKQIIWADPESRKSTRYALIYIHGFSASAGEMRPLPDMVAARLHANLFFTRLQGHGRSAPDAMNEGSVQGWMEDFAEAMEIGRRIGQEIIIMSCSTGGTITTIGLANPALSKNVAATIFLSPNFGLRTSGEFLLRSPLGGILARLLIGKRAGFEPENEIQAELWTASYPVEALLPMAKVIKLATIALVEKITTPAFFIVSNADEVVRPDKTKRIAARWGADHKLLEFEKVGTGGDHVIAGDVLSPQMSEPLSDEILNWLQGEGIQAE